mgnify:CR=1 FL=1
MAKVKKVIYHKKYLTYTTTYSIVTIQFADFIDEGENDAVPEEERNENGLSSIVQLQGVHLCTHNLCWSSLSHGI